ncbi:nucleotide sugar dehydrogenase [Clostridium sp. 'White wine YQ']|uniref:nucleotide sugar dehydrogenase n=1 Tax=Clostridium sp. 'White wine YQ' TaxID=3027474 RepID=UPI002365EA39|nr:nucleotide sugar dehydrogenase [Clostridium sp. 'White wine YQ']MDD7792759.1 nucleotide sugar dehydrogenase [Clostridium sp. 'White wine YQ']
MDLFQKIIEREEKVAVVGLGYVGMPLAVAFAKKIDVIGFDVNKAKVDLYNNGIDVTNEVGNEELKASNCKFTYDEEELKKAKFFVVAVPTPTNKDNTPDLRPVIGASRTVGRNLSKGSIVVFESTVYPGVTEEVCIPLLEEESGLKCGIDFKIGYSPERINPGDRVHTLEKITKIVSGMDEETLEVVAKTYELIIEAGVYRAESIKVAEAAKLIENTQRDVNIAFVNELSMVFNKMGIDTRAVLDAAGTKWNFLKFNPGLVGGHCIGVDPFYLVHRAQEFGVEANLVAAGRKINDGMAAFVAENVVKSLIKGDKKVKGAKVAILGLTFKENCPDTRNSKVFDIIKELKEYEIEVLPFDPVADKNELKEEYGISSLELNDIKNVDAVVFATSHSEFRELDAQSIKNFYGEGNPVLIDVKGLYNRKDFEKAGYVYFRL